MDVTLNPFAPEFQEDPYPTYRQLRESAPVYPAHFMGFRFVVLTRYEDVAAALRDPRLSAAAVPRQLLPRELSEGNLFYKDPPDHTRLRGLLTRAFTARASESLRPRVQAIAAALLDACVGRSEIDVVRDYAAPLSLQVITEVLGAPLSDCAQLKEWSDALAVLLDGTRLLSGLLQAQVAAAAFIAYLRELLERKRRQHGPDLISALLCAREVDDVLSEDELIATSLFTFIAGHETVTNLVGNGTLALLQQPQVLQQLRDDLTLLPAAVEELLRFDPPGQLLMKLATVPMRIGDQDVAPGEGVCAVMAAANRDPACFPDPDRLDLRRAESRHLAFGGGVHYCLGAALARVECQVAFGALLQRTGGLQLALGAVERQPGVVLRGLRGLRLQLGAPLPRGADPLSSR